MPSKLIGLSLVTGLMSVAAFAEPPIQSGDSLESLSKVVMTTTVNGQAGSIQELVSSGQIQIVDANQASAQGGSAQVDAEATAQPQVTDAPTLQQTPTEQSATAQAQAELATAQQQVVNQENGAASAPTTSSNESVVAPDIASSAEVPVNTEVSSQADDATAPMAQPNNK